MRLYTPTQAVSSDIHLQHLTILNMMKFVVVLAAMVVLASAEQRK